jgi:hypothetical protein
MSTDSDSVVAASAGQSRQPVTQTVASRTASEPTRAQVLGWALPLRAEWRAASTVDLVAWIPPPPAPAPPPPALPPAAPTPPVPSTAPTFPYQVIGELTEGQNVRALLATSDRTLAVRVGEEIDGQWRVEQIDSDSLVLTWRPAHLRQTIVFKPVQ